MTKEQSTQAKIFGIQRRYLAFSGYWPGDKMTKFHRFRQTLCLMINGNIIVFMAYHCIWNLNNFAKATYSLSEINKLSLDVFKFLLILNYRKKMIELIEDVSKYWEESSKVKIAAWSKVQDFVVKQTKYVTIFYVWWFFLACLSVFVNLTLVRFIGTLIDGVPFTPRMVHMPLQTRFFFDQYQTVWHALGAAIYIGVTYLPVLWVSAAVFTLYVTLIDYVSAFFTYVGIRLRNLDTLCPKSTDPSKWQEENIKLLEDEIIDIVKTHNQALGFTLRLEEMLNLAMIGYSFVCTCCNCCLFFQLIAFSVVENRLLLFNYTLFAMSMLWDLGFISWIGTKLITESESVATAAYDSQWHRLPVKCQRMLQMIVLRAHRPAHITAAKFYPVSFVSFTSVMSSSVSWLMLLKTVFLKGRE